MGEEVMRKASKEEEDILHRSTKRSNDHHSRDEGQSEGRKPLRLKLRSRGSRTKIWS